MIFLFPNLESPTDESHLRVIKFFGEKRIYFHSSTFSDSILFLNPAFFPEVNQGDIIYIRTDKSETPTVFLEVRCARSFGK